MFSDPAHVQVIVYNTWNGELFTLDRAQETKIELWQFPYTSFILSPLSMRFPPPKRCPSSGIPGKWTNMQTNITVRSMKPRKAPSSPRKWNLRLDIGRLGQEGRGTVGRWGWDSFLPRSVQSPSPPLLTHSLGAQHYFPLLLTHSRQETWGLASSVESAGCVGKSTGCGGRQTGVCSLALSLTDPALGKSLYFSESQFSHPEMSSNHLIFQRCEERMHPVNCRYGNHYHGKNWERGWT